MRGTALIAGFAMLMLATATTTWRKAHEDASPAVASPGRLSWPPLRVAQALAVGLLVGAMTGLVGIGGDFLIVPTLAIALALSMRLAVGTSLMIITATSTMALIAHLAAGRALDLGVTAACVAGALAGARLVGRLSQRLLAAGFAVLVVAVACYLLASVAFLGGPPGSS